MTTLVRRAPVIIPGPPQPAVRCVACGSTTQKIVRKAYGGVDLELCEDEAGCLKRHRLGMSPEAFQLYLKARHAVGLPGIR